MPRHGASGSSRYAATAWPTSCSVVTGVGSDEVLAGCCRLGIRHRRGLGAARGVPGGRPVINLREYQEEALAALERDWDTGLRRCGVNAATGTGKTVIMSHLAHRYVRR